MSYVAGVIFATLAMTIIVGMIHQAWTYARGQQIISRRQFAMRLSTGFLLLLTIAMIFYERLRPFTGRPLAELVYLCVLIILPTVVVVLAWQDLRELARLRHQRQAELYRNLAELQQQLLDKRGPQGKPGGTGQSE
jgi:uncharacterized protein YacL